jgi:hypothetical protein
MPKLDPADTDQPTLADVQAANQHNIAPVTPVTTASPGFFGNAPVASTPTSTPGSVFTPPMGGTASFGGYGGGGANYGTSNSFQAPQNFGGSQGQYQQVDTSAFSNAIAASADKPEEHWMKSHWRPAAAWLYMLTCFCDFIVFPVLWSMMQAYIHGAVNQQWNPITLQGAGLYHLAMGAIIGVSAYGRTREKLEDKH